MGKIKKILENELIGGTQSTDVYPVTSTKAVQDENNVRLDTILKPATKEAAGLMTASDKTKLDDINKTYLPLSGGELKGPLYVTNLSSSSHEGYDITNVNGMQSNDQYKVLYPEVWTTDGGSINLLNLLSNAAIYVAGGLEFAESGLNDSTVVDNPDSIIFDKRLLGGRFLARKGLVCYTHWKADISKNIAPPSRYGIETNEGVFPFNNQMYKFSEYDNIYIATWSNGTCNMEELTLE